MRRDWLRVLGGLAVVAVLSGCGKREEKPPPALPPILERAPLPATNAVVPVKPAPPAMPLLPETVAELQGSAEAPVVVASSGYLVRQVYKENGIVAAGDILFLLDPRSFQSEATSAGESDAGLIKITAPISGAAGRALHGAGDWIDAHDELATIATVDPIQAEYSLAGDVYRKYPESFEQMAARPMSQRTASFELILPDGSIYKKKGTLASIDHLVNTGAVNVRVSFPNPDLILYPGEFAKVRGVGP